MGELGSERRVRVRFETRLIVSEGCGAGVAAEYIVRRSTGRRARERGTTRRRG